MLTLTSDSAVDPRHGRMPEITHLMDAAAAGDRQAAAELFPLVYGELRELAAAARVAQLHLFGGLSVQEAGEAMGLSQAVVNLHVLSKSTGGPKENRRLGDFS